MVKQVVKTVGAAEFKANCARILDEIDREGTVVVVTKRGVAVAKIVPATRAQKLRRPSLAHLVKHSGDVESPIDLDWKAMA